ncbi:pectate lyase [Streptomyces sp. NPDC056660]|uniref:right-handed parallel beta-helix repeat-containing protein n=1 Tax=Streptomyces sp. NPDC056660 TaxID=3345897 RepID=UPI0036B2EF59
MRFSTGRHRRTRTLSIAAAVAVAAGATGVYLGLSNGGAQAATSTVTVATTAQLESAVANATAGTVIQVRAGTYYPAATLKSTVSGTGANRITLKAYSGEKVKIDGRNLVTADNGDSGFTLRGDGTVNNLGQNLDSYGNYDKAGHGQNADGIAIKFGSGTGNKVTGARLYDNSDDGLDLWQFSSPVTIEHSWAFGNGRNRWSDAAFEGNGNGFKLGGGADKLGSRAVSAANSWDGGVSTPAFKSTDATSAYGVRQASGALPATVFLTTGSTTIGSTMN